MTIERRTQVIPANGIIEVGRGNYCLLLTSTVAINLRLDRGGTSEGANNVQGGILLRRVQPWDTLQIFGAAGGSVEFIVGHENVEQDETDVRLQVATISGVSSFAEYPAQAVSDNAPIVVADSNQSALFAANATRRRITVHVDSNNAGSCFVRTAGGANNIGELQPGVAYRFDATYALDVRNDTGAAATFYLTEES